MENRLTLSLLSVPCSQPKCSRPDRAVGFARRISTRAIRGVGELNEILGSSVAAVGGGDASAEQPGGKIVISLKGDVT
jgi:hypothetical protein